MVVHLKTYPEFKLCHLISQGKCIKVILYCTITNFKNSALFEDNVYHFIDPSLKQTLVPKNIVMLISSALLSINGIDCLASSIESQNRDCDVLSVLG